MDIKEQAKLFENGTKFIKLLRPATIGDGILKISATEQRSLIQRYDDEIHRFSVLKFVPASGAATRMFKRIFEWIDAPEKFKVEIEDFFKKVEQLAIFEQWMQAADAADVETFESGLDSKVSWLRLLVDANSMNLANKPKGILHFHLYEKPETPLFEHLSEGAAYALHNSKSKLHFTVSPEHEGAFRDAVSSASKSFQEVEFDVDFSHQNLNTDTMVMDLANQPIIADGKLIRRPGGHGALIYNVSQLNADIVFIKNIDNVCHRQLLKETVKYKKLLGGTLLSLRSDLKLLHSKIKKGVVDLDLIREIRDKWDLRIPFDYPEISSYLARPIRVCAMVKNEGEPGGGPFWCADLFTGESLQIVEQSQIDTKNSGQRALMKSATHFNPVDLCCSLIDLEGKKIDILQFVDKETYLITEKTLDGKPIKVLEWPGLWNGSMANWITVFVEVPLITFNPVKELADLFRPAHNF